MLTYKAGYKIDPEVVFAKVLDFPGVVTEGYGLEDARTMLADALMLMADTYLFEGDPLPRPNPDAIDPEVRMDVIEPIYLYLNATRNLNEVPSDFREYKRPSSEVFE